MKIDVATDCNYTNMRFEWDETKRRANYRHHGIDFADLEGVFEELTVSVVDDRYDYNERRFFTLGILNGIVVAISHTETDEAIRIISARKALKHEEANYFKEIKN